jgi:CheY-like chemotaxis protein
VPNILICDDDRTARFLLKRILVRELDANVTEAPDGLQAIRLLSSSRYDLLILDLRMPVMDGPETLEIVRNTPAWRDLPVIVLSGETDAEVVRRVVQASPTSCSNRWSGAARNSG